jgi:hypothetical protein
MTTDIPLQTNLFRLSEIPDLENIWRDLEDRSDSGFMLSWSWIGVWIKSQLNGLDPYVLKVTEKEKVVGLAVFVVKDIKITRGVHAKCLHFHCTGDLDQDKVCIEYNNVLFEKGFGERGTQSIINFLLEEKNFPKNVSGWEFLNFGMIAEDDLRNFSHKNLLNWNASETSTYGVDLTEFKVSDEGYLKHLSKNTRYQIRRSLRLYEERGPLEVNVAQSIDEALSFFRDAGEYHKLRWEGDDDDGDYIGVEFSKFHETLIKEGFPRKEIDLIKITAGETCIGFLYNFIHKDVVYFYQCAFSYEDDKRLKPGLVSHYLGINKYICDGKKYYDFMAGHSQYKNSLSEKREIMRSGLICRRSFKLQILAFLKKYFGRLK